MSEIMTDLLFQTDEEELKSSTRFWSLMFVVLGAAVRPPVSCLASFSWSRASRK